MKKNKTFEEMVKIHNVNEIRCGCSKASRLI